MHAADPREAAPDAPPDLPPPPRRAPRAVGGVERLAIQAAMIARVTALAARTYADPRDAVRAGRLLVERTRWFDARLTPGKMMRVGPRRWMPGFLFPTWPSPTFDRWALAQLDDLVPWSARPGRYTAVVMLALTSRCPLSCAHCSAAAELGPDEHVDLDRVVGLVGRLQDRGLMQLHLTGGEPMLRFDDILTLLGSMRRDTDVWIDTSGVGLTPARAEALARAGLTGVVVSIDDWRPDAHDAFRGHPGVFRHATAACRAAADAGLVVATSVVPPRGVTRAWLDRYAALSTALGAAFIRVVEPKATGRWAGEAVTLTDADRATVEAFERESNALPALRDRPCVIDHDRVHRQIGCLTAGDRGFYVDTRGRAHGCPFCGHAGPDVFDGDLDAAIAALRSAGCERYAAARTFDRFSSAARGSA